MNRTTNQYRCHDGGGSHTGQAAVGTVCVRSGSTPRSRRGSPPTRGSWLNLAERRFAELTNRKLRRSAHRSVKELEDDMEAWIKAWNEDPKPFVWTKTADEILDNLANYCTRLNQLTNDSGH
jgi:hypothetical protein